MTSSHLTDSQLAEQLAGNGNAASEDHLAACAVCRAEISRMRASLRVFNQASLEWSEHLPRVHRPAPSSRPAVVWALCIAVLAWVLLAGLFRFPLQVRYAAYRDGGDSTAELSRDNALLSAIDKEFDSTELSPKKMYGAQ
jgi:hypothetical protein